MESDGACGVFIVKVCPKPSMLQVGCHIIGRRHAPGMRRVDPLFEKSLWWTVPRLSASYFPSAHSFAQSCISMTRVMKCLIRLVVDTSFQSAMLGIWTTVRLYSQHYPNPNLGRRCRRSYSGGCVECTVGVGHRYSDLAVSF